MKKSDLLKKIASYEPNTSLAIIIRHTEREQIEDATDSHDVPLTNKGKEMAIEFGKKLPTDRPIRIFYSCVPRCEETAELILKGFKEKGGDGSLLGDRDFLGYHFMTEPKKALQLLNELGEPEFIEKWYNGDIAESIMHPPEKSAFRLLNSIVNNFDKALDLHITHDFNVILLFSHLYDLRKEGFRWPNFLEGVLIEEKSGGVKLYFDDKEGSFKIDDLR